MNFCMKIWFQSAVICLIGIIEFSDYITARQGLLNVTAVSSTSIDLAFSAENKSRSFIITIKPRHGIYTFTTKVLASRTISITNLTESTLYDISVRHENASEDIGRASLQTYPGAPNLSLSIPTTTSVLIFFHSANRARISKWGVEYRNVETNTIKRLFTEQYYAFWLTKLLPNTVYEVRARCHEIRQKNDFLILNNSEFSTWTTFSTDSLSVFGSVSLKDTSNTHAVLTNAYTNLKSLKSLDVMSIISTTVHYRLKIRNKNFDEIPESSYILQTSEFTESYVNRGEFPTSAKCRLDDVNTWNLEYCGEGFEDLRMYMLVSVEDSQTHIIDIIADEEEPQPKKFSKQFSFSIMTGKYRIDNEESDLAGFPLNSVIGIEPKYLVLDRLENGPRNLYAEYEADDILSGYESVSNRYMRTTDLAIPDLINATRSYFSNGSFFTLYIPNIDKSIRYDLFGEGISNITYDESDIDGSESLKIEVESLTNDTSYALNMKVTQRKHDGTTGIATARLNVTLSYCSECFLDASCESFANGSVLCSNFPPTKTVPTINVNSIKPEPATMTPLMLISDTEEHTRVPRETSAASEITASTSTIIYVIIFLGLLVLFLLIVVIVSWIRKKKSSQLRGLEYRSNTLNTKPSAKSLKIINNELKSDDKKHQHLKPLEEVRVLPGPPSSLLMSHQAFRPKLNGTIHPMFLPTIKMAFTPDVDSFTCSDAMEARLCNPDRQKKKRKDNMEKVAKMIYKARNFDRVDNVQALPRMAILRTFHSTTDKDLTTLHTNRNNERYVQKSEKNFAPEEKMIFPDGRNLKLRLDQSKLQGI